MKIGSQWTAHSAQQLVRYEALFKLLDDIQSRENILVIAQYVAKQWKYFSNVSCWRLVVALDQGYQIIDGFRGDAQVQQVDELPDWDKHYWSLDRPQLLVADEPAPYAPPEHMQGKAIREIEILPFMRGEGVNVLLSVAARHEAFNELDKRFIHLFGGYLADRVAGILLRKSVLETLTNRATFDALTGLYNRAVVIDRLENQLIHCQRLGQSLSVILTDVDHFKNINDTFGHLAGDEVLEEIGRRFRQHVRRGELIGRYGGEEFLFVLYPCNKEEALEAAQRFQRIIAQERFAITSDLTDKVIITLSLGLCCTEGRTEMKAQDLLRRADDALYRAKAEGRNRLCTCS